MPTSITLVPDARMPSASAAHNSGPERRPSRPTTIVSRPRSCASDPNACPIAATMGGVSVRPTTPRMS
jgi:hypothetical protein